MEKKKILIRTLNEDLRSAVSEADGAQSSSSYSPGPRSIEEVHGNPLSKNLTNLSWEEYEELQAYDQIENYIENSKQMLLKSIATRPTHDDDRHPSIDKLKASKCLTQLCEALSSPSYSPSSTHVALRNAKKLFEAVQEESEKATIQPKGFLDMLSTTASHDADMHLPTNELEDSKTSLVSEDLMERENSSTGESRTNGDKAENVSESSGIRQRRLSRFDPEQQIAEDGERKTPDDERTPGLLSSRGKEPANSDGSEIKHKIVDKKGPKQVKAKSCSGLEKESSSQSSAKVVGMKSADSPSLDGLREMESDRKVQESLNTFIRQTMGREPYMSFSSRPGDKPLQRILEHQQAMEKCVKSLKVDIDIRDALENNANMDPHQYDVERDPSGTKGRGSQADRNVQTIKSNVPLSLAALAAAAAKNPDLPGWPLLSPSKVQLQKCEKCSRDFFSPLNHRRHIRTHHRRISHADKEDLTLKRKNVAAFWDKLNPDKTQQIFADSRKYDSEGLSVKAVLSSMIASEGQSNPITLPAAYIKAGQDLLDMLENKQRVLPLSSEKFLLILDQASEKTFLCSQGDVSKIGLDEKNLVASLGYIVEQTLVKAWMVDKDAEALRNQQELFKEEEAAQMKRVRNIARKKKKKEKSRQKGLKERKAGPTQSALNEENESVDGENPSPEIVEEDDSPTASSASVNSCGLENQLLEPPEMEVQNGDRRDHNVGGEDGRLRNSMDTLSIHVTSKEVPSGSVDEDRVQQSGSDLASNGEEGDQYSKSPSFNQGKVEDQGGCGHILEQDQSVTESRKRTPWRPYKEPLRFDYHDSYQRGSWVPDLRFQEGLPQNSSRTMRKPAIGTSYSSNIERGSSPVPGFYRGKPANPRGTVPFPATQQWAKKAQTPASSDHIKDGQEDGSSLEHYTSKSSVKDSAVAHAVPGRETDADTTGSISRAEKEPDLRAFGKKELAPAAVPLAKVVANTGGLSSLPTAPFNLNVNSEDWPPLSNSRAAYYPKSAGRYPLTSYQCELNSRPVNKLNIDRGDGYQAGLESKVEPGSILSVIPSTRGPVDHNTSGSVTVGRQKGIMIGSVSVSLGDYVHLSRPGLGSAGRRICTPLRANQSYTSVLAAPPGRYTRDPIASTAGRQNANEEISCPEFEESSDVQVIDSYGGPVYYRTSSVRSTSSVNFNVRHMRGLTFERTHTYPLGDRGDRGILPKQPSWSGGPVRHVPQKVWRPVRSTAENTDPNADGGPDIEGSLISSDNDKDPAEPPGSKGGLNAASTSQSEGPMQVWDTDICRVEQRPTTATDTRAQGDGNGVLSLKGVKENAPQTGSHDLYKSMVSDTQHLQCRKETSKSASVMSKDEGENACQPVKYNATEQNTKCTVQTNAESMDDEAHTETAVRHSAWIAEAVEFHLSRCHSALKDPETVVSKCEGEHPELQTSAWVDFMDSLPSIATRLTLSKEDARDPTFGAPDGGDQSGTKNSKTIQNEQTSANAQNSRREGSGAGSRAASTAGEEPRDPSSVCESGSPSGIDSTAGGPFSGSQNHGMNDNEGRIGSRCGSSCSDSSLSSNSRTERRDWTGTVNTTRDRPQDKRYMPRREANTGR